MNPVAIVTGGAYGAGREIARELATRGYAVIVVYRRDQAGAEPAVEEIRSEVAHDLRARDITVNGLTPGLECPGADHDVADLVALLEQWSDWRPTVRDRRAPCDFTPGPGGAQ